jgi:[ribosomal protein S5]-alanine N-acetyltransferase
MTGRLANLNEHSPGQVVIFELETERLRLMALDLDNLRLRLNNYPQMQRNLGLEPVLESGYGHFPYQQQVDQAIAVAIKRIERRPEAYLWHTFWQLVHRQENRIIGEFDFHDVPNEAGETEFGFMTLPEYQNQGYMTEAARALLDWAFQQDGVSALIAETEKQNKASQRVLEKLGARIYEETESEYRWKIVR